MYEYRFVRLESHMFGRSPAEDYRQIILDEDAQGWDFVQIFVSGTNSHGAPTLYDLIFRRPRSEP